MICADPQLAIAEKDLNTQVVALVGKLREEEVKGALAEFARWERTRDRLRPVDRDEGLEAAELAAGLMTFREIGCPDHRAQYPRRAPHRGAP